MGKILIIPLLFMFILPLFFFLREEINSEIFLTTIIKINYS